MEKEGKTVRGVGQTLGTVSLFQGKKKEITCVLSSTRRTGESCKHPKD